MANNIILSFAQPKEFTHTIGSYFLLVKLLTIANFERIIFTLQIKESIKIKSFYLMIDAAYMERDIDLRKSFDNPSQIFQTMRNYSDNIQITEQGDIVFQFDVRKNRLKRFQFRLRSAEHMNGYDSALEFIKMKIEIESLKEILAKQKMVNNQAKDKSSKILRWNDHENLMYLKYLTEHEEYFSTRQLRRKHNVFLNFSKIIKTRTPIQVKTHHQKLITNSKTVSRIIQHFESKYCTSFKSQCNEREDVGSEVTKRQENHSHKPEENFLIPEYLNEFNEKDELDWLFESS